MLGGRLRPAPRPAAERSVVPRDREGNGAAGGDPREEPGRQAVSMHHLGAGDGGPQTRQPRGPSRLDDPGTGRGVAEPGQCVGGPGHAHLSSRRHESLDEDTYVPAEAAGRGAQDEADCGAREPPA